MLSDTAGTVNLNQEVADLEKQIETLRESALPAQEDLCCMQQKLTEAFKYGSKDLSALQNPLGDHIKGELRLEMVKEGRSFKRQM